ncbi:MAG: peptidylprolyl isomerase [Bacteroidetes bacterium]|nr:peptidylprolyl isomerase [Bacteroidota bacterium]
MKTFFITLCTWLIAFGSACTSQNTNKYVIKTNMGSMTLLLYEDTPKHTSNFIKLVKEDYYDGLLFHRVIKDFMIQTGDPESKNASPDQQLGSGGPGYTIEAEIKPHHYHKKGAIAAARQSDNVNPEKRSSGSQFYIVHGKKLSEKQLTTDFNKLSNYFKQYINEEGNQSLKNQVISLQRNRQFDQLEQLIFQYKDTLAAYYDIAFARQYPVERLEDYTTKGGAPHLDDQYTVFGEIIDGFDVLDKIAQIETNQLNRPVKDIVITDIKPAN